MMIGVLNLPQNKNQGARTPTFLENDPVILPHGRRVKAVKAFEAGVVLFRSNWYRSMGHLDHCEELYTQPLHIIVALAIRQGGAA